MLGVEFGTDELEGVMLELERVGGPKELFAARFKSAESVPLATLLARAGGVPGADASLVV